MTIKKCGNLVNVEQFLKELEDEKTAGQEMVDLNNRIYHERTPDPNELIFEESDSGAEQEVVEKKNQIKLALTRVKAVRRFNKLKSLNYNLKVSFGEKDNYNRPLLPKKTVIHKDHKSNKSLNAFTKSKSDRLNKNSNKKLDSFRDEKYLNNKEEYKDDEIFVYELLYRFIDL